MNMRGLKQTRLNNLDISILYKDLELEHKGAALPAKHLPKWNFVLSPTEKQVKQEKKIVKKLGNSLR